MVHGLGVRARGFWRVAGVGRGQACGGAGRAEAVGHEHLYPQLLVLVEHEVVGRGIAPAEQLHRLWCRVRIRYSEFWGYNPV